MMKRFLLIFAMAVLLFGQGGTVVPTTVTDFVGDGVNHRIAASGSARWVIFIAAATNAAVVRVGDSTINANRGARIAPGGGLMFPEPAAESRTSIPEHRYDLSRIYYRAAVNDRLSVIWIQ